MVWLILSVIFTIGTIIGIGIYIAYKNDKIKGKIKEKCGEERFKNPDYDFDKEFNYKYNKEKKSYLKCLWALPIMLLSIFGLFATVQTGHTGIITVFGSVQEQTLEAGLHTKLWWQDVVQMDNRNQKEVIHLEAFSKDIQEVKVVYSINYQISKQNASIIYKTIGVNYYNVVMLPRIEEIVKSVIAEYTAETLINNRSELSTRIFDNILNELDNYNIEVLSANVEDLNFSEAFTRAVEDKQVASQNKQKAQIEQERLTYEQEQKAERDVIQANAEARINIIQAEADMEVAKIGADSAEYQGKKQASIILQELISLNGYHLGEDGTTVLDSNNQVVDSEDLKQATQNLLLQKYLNAWNGELPNTYIGTNDFADIFKALLDSQP